MQLNRIYRVLHMVQFNILSCVHTAYCKQSNCISHFFARGLTNLEFLEKTRSMIRYFRTTTNLMGRSRVVITILYIRFCLYDPVLKYVMKQKFFFLVLRPQLHRVQLPDPLQPPPRHALVPVLVVVVRSRARRRHVAHDGARAAAPGDQDEGVVGVNWGEEGQQQRGGNDAAREAGKEMLERKKKIKCFVSSCSDEM